MTRSGLIREGSSRDAAQMLPALARPMVRASCALSLHSSPGALPIEWKPYETDFEIWQSMTIERPSPNCFPP